MPYWEYHRINADGELEKRCSTHYINFPDENVWMPCTDEYFHKNKTNKKDGLHPYCKKCNSKKGSIHYQNNREKHDLNHKNNYQGTLKHKKWSSKNNQKYKHRQSEWRRENPDKIKEYNEKHRAHDITITEWQYALSFFNYQCAYCGITEQNSLKVQKQRLHKDHVDCNGANDLSNAVPACRSCNSKKHQDNMEEWFITQEFFSEKRLQKIYQWLSTGYMKYIEDEIENKLNVK